MATDSRGLSSKPRSKQLKLATRNGHSAAQLPERAYQPSEHEIEAAKTVLTKRIRGPSLPLLASRKDPSGT